MKTSATVLLSLIESHCIPILMYACECVVWNKSMINSMEHAYNQAYNKIFKTYDVIIVNRCKYHMGYLPVELKYVSKKINFLSCLNKSPIIVIRILKKMDNDFDKLSDIYSLGGEASLKDDLWNYEYFVRNSLPDEVLDN